MPIRSFRDGDARAVAALSAACARSEEDFVLNPLWEDADDLAADLSRHGIGGGEHVLVAEDAGEVLGISGFLRDADSELAALICPIVARDARGRGLGGELLRAAVALGRDKLGVRVAAASVGTRNRGGYSLLVAHGFRPVRQHFLLRSLAPPAPPALPADFELAPASAADLPALHALYQASGFAPRTPEQMAHALGDGRHIHQVVRHAGQAVAFAELETHWKPRAWVAFVAVSAVQRDRGLGSAVVAAALARAYADGARSALLILSPANRTALRAYEKVGFRLHRVVDVLEHVL